MIPQTKTGTVDAADWTLNRTQSEFMAAWLSGQYPIVSLMGGWGVGKTRLVAYLCQAQHEEKPGSTGFYVTDSMGRGSRTIAVEFAAILEPLGWSFHSFYRGSPAPHWLSPPLRGKQTRVWVLSWKRPTTKHVSANSLEGPSCDFGIADECNQYNDGEIAAAMLGRVRSGNPSRIALLGKPMFNGWWLDFAWSRGGYAFKASSEDNRRNLPGFDAWIKTLSPREYRENVLADPLPPRGAILDMFDPSPGGNFCPEDWHPQEHHRTYAAFDFGVRNPYCMVISHCVDLDADVIWMEHAPDGASVFDLCELLRQGRPDIGMPGIFPAYRNDRPSHTQPVHVAVGDRSGRNRRDDAGLTSAMSDILQSPDAGGLGLKCQYTEDKSKIEVIAGIRAIWRRILDNTGKRRLLIHPKLWRAGQNAKGRSLAKSIHGYKWRTGSTEIVNKDGIHDHQIDALRYFVIAYRWPKGNTGAAAAVQAFSDSGGGHVSRRDLIKSKMDRR